MTDRGTARKSNEMRMAVNLVFMTIIGFNYNVVNTLNILGVYPFEGRSHFIAFEPYLLALARRGHNVTVISHFPQKITQKNYHDISLEGTSDLLKNSVFVAQRSYMDIIQSTSLLMDYGVNNCKILLADKNVQRLWKSNIKFDLVVVEQFNSDCSLGLAYKLRAPVVGLTSQTILPWQYERFGIPYNPSYVPFVHLEGGTKPTLYQRIERTIFHLYYILLYKYKSQAVDQNILAEYFDNIPPLEELGREIKFMLVYQNFALMGPNLYPTNIIEVGGSHVAQTKPLPEDLKKFIEESKNGVIYISFGTLFKGTTAPKYMIAAVVEALSLLPQRVIWKWDGETLPSNSKNIYASKWTPQNDILAHPNVHAFYSHCGLMGTTEAIHHGVPMVAMPIFGDQPSTAAAIEESGLGVQIHIWEITKDNLLEKFKTVLDPKFRANVKRLSRLWHDRPMTPLDTAIYWTEFAARNHNVTLRTRAADVPYYQYLGLDILAVFSGLVLLVIYLVSKAISLVTTSDVKKSAKKMKKQ